MNIKLPEKVTIREIGPRDGFQNVKEYIPTDKKIQIINMLIEAGYSQMQLTSFVNPTAIPQLKDASEVSKAIFEQHGTDSFNALVANRKGVERASAAGYKKLTWAMSVSDAHCLANINKKSIDSINELGTLIKEYPDIKFKLDFGTTFGCPFSGEVKKSRILNMTEKGIDYGVSEICLCDTIGVANPKLVAKVLEELRKKYPDFLFSLHLHDTWGMALANILVSLDYGITVFESSIAGLGGCPFAPGASGNVATEDLANMMEQMGIATGLDMQKLVKAGKIIFHNIDNTAAGRIVRIEKSKSVYNILV